MPRSKKIVVFATWIGKSWSKQLQVFCNLKVRQGHTVFFVSDLQKIKKEQIVDGIRLIGWPDQSPGTLRGFLFLLKLFLRVRPDITIANFSSVPFVSVMAFLFRVPVRMVFFHTTFGIHTLDANWRHSVRSMVYRLCTHLVAVNHEIYLQAIENFFIPEKKMHVLVNSYNMSSWSPPAKKRKRILTVAALEVWKGVDRLILAFSRIHNDFPGYKLVIIGSGSQHNELVMLAAHEGLSDCVLFLGVMKYEVVQQELNEAEIFALLSRADGTPQVILEAMANGCAVMATGVGGIPEVITHNRNGLLLNMDNVVESAAEGLKRLCSNNELRVQLAQHAVEDVRDKFSSISWASKLDLIIGK